MYIFMLHYNGFNVAPFAGAWIEIAPDIEVIIFDESLPSRERGLKLL